MTSELEENYTGYDIALFQRWRSSEHGIINWVPGILMPKSYRERQLKKVDRFLSKKNILVECFNITSPNPFGELKDYDWKEVVYANKRRLDSLKASQLPKLSNRDRVNNLYKIKGGLVYKYTWNSLCLCFDKTYIISNFQRKIRQRNLKRKHSARIIQKYWNKYSWDPKTIFGRRVVLNRAKL